MTICWRSKQTPDPSVQFLVNMQTTDKFNADEQLRIGWPYANANWFQTRYDNYNGFKFDFNPEYVWIWYYSATTFGRSIKKDGGKRIYQDGSILY